MYVVVVSFTHDDSSELDILASICMENLYCDSTPGEMPISDIEFFNEYSNPTFVLREWDFVNFTPVVIFNCLGTSLVPDLNESRTKRHIILWSSIINKINYLLPIVNRPYYFFLRFGFEARNKFPQLIIIVGTRI